MLSNFLIINFFFNLIILMNFGNIDELENILISFEEKPSARFKPHSLIVLDGKNVF